MNPILTEEEEKIERVRTGQRIVLYSVLLSMLSIALLLGGVFLARILNDRTLALTVAFLRFALWFGGLVVGIVGIIRLSKGLGYSVLGRMLFVISLFIPFVNLIVLLVLSSKATMVLAKAGYKVGLMGATERSG
jgi:hypothetical protein